LGETSELSRQYDGIFARYGHGLPVAFLRALAKRESGMDPAEVTESAAGILQVVPSVMDGFNKRAGEGQVTRAQLFDPATNVRVATWQLRFVIDQYRKHRDRNLHENWSNPEFVKLLVAGWNSGYSEVAGVGKVASYLEGRGMPVTLDNVYASAAAAGGTVHLQNPAKKAWQQSVAALYYAQPDWRPAGGMVGLLALGALGYVLYRYRNTRSRA
jgi:soluble lytic murein transglycosylase-like protein